MNHGPLPRQFAHRLLLITLSILLLSSFIVSRIQSSGGAVDVRDFKIPTHNGQWLAADLFKPRTATAENPAPLIIVVPGFQRSKEALSNIALELARRGFVTMSIDPYAQGGSSASMSRRAATTEGYGMFALVEFAHDTDILNYVDKSRIGTTGHSAGGNAAIRGANYFGRQAIERGEPSKLHSVFVSGYVLTLRDDVLGDVRSNVGMSYAYYDEGAYRNELENGDMTIAPESLRLVNSGLPEAEHISEVELGRWYGSIANRTARVVHNERLLHPFQPYNREATANQIAYFEQVFDWESPVELDDQIWPWKEALSMLSLVASMILLIPLASLALEAPFFARLVHPLPPPQSRPRGSGRVLFWVLFATGALIACFSYIPMAELSQKIFVDASTRRQTWFFPQRMNNAVMMWALFNGLVGLGLFFGSYWWFGRHHGANPRSWGSQTSRSELGRTFLLALLLFGAYYGILFLVYFIFHVDYRFWFMGVRPFEPVLLVLLCMYAPAFFVFFLSNSLRVNGAMRFDHQPEWRSMLLAGLANSLGLLLIVIVQYTTFAATGTVYWTDGWLYVNLLFAVVPMMFVLPYFNRYFFRLTGRIYLGPMTTCLVFIMILLSNTVVYIPI